MQWGFRRLGRTALRSRMPVFQTHLKFNRLPYTLKNIVKPNFIPSESQKLHNKSDRRFFNCCRRNCVTYTPTSNFAIFGIYFLNPRGSNQQAISGSEKIYVRNEILFTISKFYLYCLDPFVTWVCLKIPKCVKTSAECRV